MITLNGVLQSASDRDLRPTKSSNLEAETLAGGGSLELLNVVGSGCVKSIELVIGGLSVGVSYDSFIKIYADDMVTPKVSAPVRDFFFSRGFGGNDGAGTSWLSPLIGMSKHYNSLNTDVRVGWYRYLDIPFYSAIKIVLENGDNVATGSVFSQVYYKVGNSVKDMPGHYYWSYLGSTPGNPVGRATTPYEEINLLNLASGSGVLESTWLTVFQNPGQAVGEGNLDIFVGGEEIAGIQSSGTEDWFMAAYAWVGVYAQMYHGLVCREGSGYLFNAYRILLPENITFRDGVKVVWHAGNAAQGLVDTNCELWSGVGYYLF